MLSKRSFQSRNDSRFGCRICLEESKLKDLLTPCKCKGTLKFIHKSCFIHWLNKSKSLICELCHTRYRNLMIRSKQPNFLDFLRKEPEWLISFMINSLPLIYDIYYIRNYSEFNFNSIISSSTDLNDIFNPIQPPIIQLNSINLSFFISFKKYKLNVKTIPITFPIEIINMLFYLRDLYIRFQTFKRTHRNFVIYFAK